jgi:hypothetical protein
LSRGFQNLFFKVGGEVSLSLGTIIVYTLEGKKSRVFLLWFCTKSKVSGVENLCKIVLDSEEKMCYNVRLGKNGGAWP